MISTSDFEYTLTYMHVTYIPAYMHPYCIHKYIPACINIYLHTYVHTHLYKFITTFIHISVHAYLHPYKHPYITHTYTIDYLMFFRETSRSEDMISHRTYLDI